MAQEDNSQITEPLSGLTQLAAKGKDFGRQWNYPNSIPTLHPGKQLQKLERSSNSLLNSIKCTCIRETVGKTKQKTNKIQNQYNRQNRRKAICSTVSNSLHSVERHTGKPCSYPGHPQRPQTAEAFARELTILRSTFAPILSNPYKNQPQRQQTSKPKRKENALL